MDNNKKDRSHIQSAEMKLVRYERECTKADKIRNDTLKSDLNVFTINHKMEENEMKLKDYVNRRVESRLLKKIMNYRPIGKICWIDVVRGNLMIETGLEDIT